MNTLAQPRHIPQPLTSIQSLPILLHLVSLDAPIVAAFWCWFFAAAFHTPIPITAPISLALGVWVLYIADRLLDSRSIASQNTDTHSQSLSTRLEARHIFHARHPRLMLACILSASTLLLWMLAHYMPWFVFRNYVPIAVLVSVYFLAVHFLPVIRHSLPTKEIAVGLFFAAATITPTLSRLQPASHLHLLIAAALFAALCTLNCIAIEHWESRPLIRTHAFPIALALVGIAALACLRFIPTVISISILLSAATLFLLHLNRRRIPRLTLRIAADAALLTPLLLLVWPR